MKVVNKIRWAVAVAIALLLFNMVYLAARSARMQATTNDVLMPLHDRLKHASEWSGLAQANLARQASVAALSDAAAAERTRAEMAATEQRMTQLAEGIRAGLLPGRETDAFDRAARSRQAGVSAPHVADIQALIEAQEAEVQRIQADLAQTRSNSVVIGVVFNVSVFAGLLLGALWLVRVIRKPLAEANRLAASIARGDLSQTIQADGTDEFGELMRSLAAMNQSLATMVRQVRNGADSIASATSEISSGNQDLSVRTERTSADLQATASSMGTLMQSVQLSASAAQQAATLASNASEVARRGGEVVGKVVSTMETINHSSRQIHDIIAVIDGIAFQTNILALNAAVEAARAGEQGRGFAVVASEVRNLAQRSAAAAKEISTLINTSVEQVGVGMGLVNEAGATVGDIVASVRQVTEVVENITATVSTQSEGIAQVNQSVANLDQMTQQNAALVEESAAVAQGMNEQARALAQAVHVFVVSP